MREKDVSLITSRQISNVSQSIPKIRAGIDAVSESPGVAAANSVEAMVQNFLAKYNSGELEAALRGIDLEAWKESTLAGTARIGPGMERKRSVIEAFHTQLQAHQLGYMPEIDAMPAGTLEASRARMNKNFDAMVEFKFKK